MSRADGVLVVVLGFLVLFAAMTFEVISRTGLDILSGLALVLHRPDGNPR